jgi:hypothetical protein
VLLLHRLRRLDILLVQPIQDLHAAIMQLIGQWITNSLFQNQYINMILPPEESFKAAGNTPCQSVDPVLPDRLI